MADIANEISGASTDLVEQVLEQYGDPVADAEDPGPEDPGRDNMVEDEASADDASDAAPDSPALEDLSEKQLETLRAIRDRPSATQEEIGEALDLSGAAVSNRLTDIEGFDWEDRERFVASQFESPVVADGQGETVGQAHADAIEQRLDELEGRLETLTADTESGGLSTELAHKAIHAVVRSDQITEDEELEIIRSLL